MDTNTKYPRNIIGKRLVIQILVIAISLTVVFSAIIAGF